MAKNKDNVIALQIGEYESKIEEFQTYLKKNSILSLQGLEERFKEIDLQKKMMDALPAWLTALKALKESEQNKLELRGGAEISSAAKVIMDR